MIPCKKCKEDFEPGTEGLEATFCPKCVVLVKKAQSDRAIQKQKKEEQQVSKEDSGKQEKSSDEKELEQLVQSFQKGPPAMQACASNMPALSKDVTVQVLVRALKATQYAAERIPGSNPSQLLFIFTEAFQRDSSVVLGGSRVKSYFTKNKHYREENEIQDMGEELKKASDLDVAYGKLKPGTAAFINKEADKKGPPPIEQMIIMEGQKSPTFGTLPAPEEFFHKTGDRPDKDPKSKIEKQATPSGCITFAPDGTIQENPPDVPVEKLVIPKSGRTPPKLDFV